MKSNNKYVVVGILILIIGITAIWITTKNKSADTANQVPESAERLTAEIIAKNLNTPWDIAFLPDNTMLVTERSGKVLHIESGKSFTIEGVKQTSEGGLLGITLHPDFVKNNYVYLYQTTEVNNGLQNRVVRYTYSNNTLTFNKVIIDNIPGAANHDGGGISFGPDGYLYISVGDAGNEPAAQDKNSVSGSILRITDEGVIPADNPFGNSVYSFGHRNPQGLAWDSEGRLWSTEHGRSGLKSGFDEINLITKGANYGWPDSEGDNVKNGTVAPSLHSSATNTWAPASAAYYKGSIFFGGLRGEALYEAKLEGDKVINLVTHFKGEFGRIRAVRVGPDGFLYISTSNKDGRGNAKSEDDKILRIKL